MKRKISLVTILAWLALTTLTVSAQSGGNYDLTWSSIDGGGGTATGGPYALIGTIGQADAGSQSGGSYTLAGGFVPGLISPAVSAYHVYLPLTLK